MTTALSITGLKKSYGRKVALKGLNMKVPKNTVYGFLGENGAGKTTTFSILGGFISANAGTFDMPGKMGMLPQDARFGVGRRIDSQLKILAKLSGVESSKVDSEIKRVLKAVNMEGSAKVPVNKCSHGMYKRIGIAQALLGDPDILLFDEPTAGLDPKNAHDIRHLIQTLNHNRTVVISSHNLAEIEQICDHVGIISKGEMVYEGPVEELVSQNTELNFKLSEMPNLKTIEKLKGINKASWSEEEKCCHIEFNHEVLTTEAANALILEQLLKDKIGVRSINSGNSLEHEYLKKLNLD